MKYKITKSHYLYMPYKAGYNVKYAVENISLKVCICKDLKMMKMYKKPTPY